MLDQRFFHESLQGGFFIGKKVKGYNCYVGWRSKDTTTELKMTEKKTTVHILSLSHNSIAAQQKIVLADGSLCSRQEGAGSV